MNLYLQSVLAEPVRIAACYPAGGSWFYLLAAAVMEAMAVYSWRYRKVPAALYLTLAIAARATWLFALVMVSISQTLAEKTVWNLVMQSSVIMLLPLFPLMALHITEQSPQLIRVIRRGLFLFTAIFFLAMLTNEWHGWWLRSMEIHGSELVFYRGPLQLLFMLFTYWAAVAGIIICIVWGYRTSGLRRWRALALPGGLLIAMAGYLLWGKNPQGGIVPYLPLGFVLGSMTWIAIFYGLRIFNLMELAEHTVMRNMEDCVVVIDVQGYIVEMNPAANKLFAPWIKEGSLFAEVAVSWPELCGLTRETGAVNGEITLKGLGNIHYRYRVSKLLGYRGRDIGKAIVLSDISAEKKAQEDLAEQRQAVAIMTERRRLGRELHDGEVQVWGYLLLQFQALRKLLADGKNCEADVRLIKLIALADDIHTDVRDSIAGLKAAPAKRGLVATIRDFVNWYERSYGLHTSLTVSPEAPEGFSPTVDLQVLRIVQETLTNTRKYANAKNVSVEIGVEQEEAVVVIRDDGVGFLMSEKRSADDKHYGLGIMRERAEEIGGRLEIESMPGCGTTVTVRLPRGQKGE